MPQIDIPLKKLIELRPADWVRFIQPDCQDDWVTEFKTNYTPKKESRLDGVLKINDPNGTYLLNLEPMGYRDNALPARMLRYRSDIWEATMTKDNSTPPIKQVVVFFYEKDDNRQNRLYDKWEYGILKYQYAVVRIWEQPRQPVIDAKLIGLYPLLPLMLGPEDETPKQVLNKCVSIIQEIENESLRLDLLAVMAIMAGGKYSDDLILSLIRREMIMNSPIFQEWVKEERAEAEAIGEARGEARGEAKGVISAQNAICNYLKARFGPASKGLQKQVKNISSLTKLNNIIDNIYTADTLEEAQAVVLGAN